MHGKNNNRAAKQRIILGCAALSYPQSIKSGTAKLSGIFFKISDNFAANASHSLHKITQNSHTD